LARLEGLLRLKKVPGMSAKSTFREERERKAKKNSTGAKMSHEC